MNKIKKFFYTVFNKKPGRRFLLAYRATNHYIYDHFVVKLAVMLIAVILLSIGVLFLFLPGPGIIFLLAGTVLLCMVSRRIATSLDNLEKNINDYFYPKK